MTMQAQAIFDAALALPEADRFLLVERLLETFPDEQEDLTDDELVAELDRRRAEWDREASIGIPWSELSQES